MGSELKINYKICTRDDYRAS